MELSIEVTVECSRCGTELEAQITTHRGYQTLKVDPCYACMDDAAENARGGLESTIEELREQVRELQEGAG